MLRVLEDGKKEVQVVGLQEVPVHDEDDVGIFYFDLCILSELILSAFRLDHIECNNYAQITGRIYDLTTLRSCII